MTTELDASRLLSDRIVHACRAHQQTAHELARLLVELVDGGHLRALGHATLAEYADTVLGIEPRMARDLVRIGRRLAELPVLDAAMASGHLAWTKARELVRVATPETEAAWVERAALRSSRALEREVAHVGRGEAPPTGDLAEREPVRRRVVFEMESVDAEVVFRALALLRAQAGLDAAEAEDGALLAALARRVIHEAEEAEVRGAGAEGRGAEAEADARGVEARGAEAEADARGAEARGAEAAADARGVEARGAEAEADARGGEADALAADDPDAPAAAGSAPRAPSGERYRVVLEHCPSCRDTHARTHVGHAEVSDTITGEAACDAEIVELRPGPDQGHRTRTIPPATRRVALHRAGWRCEVPGCRNTLWLDLHHVHGWARGGGHALANLAVVCSTHHRAIHAGVLAAERLATGALRITHHDGR